MEQNIVEIVLSKVNIRVGDVAIHNDGNVGIVFETNYNDAEEVEINWVTTNMRASRTSIDDLKRVVRQEQKSPVALEEMIEKKVDSLKLIITTLIETYLSHGASKERTIWEIDPLMKLFSSSLQEAYNLGALEIGKENNYQKGFIAGHKKGVDDCVEVCNKNYNNAFEQFTNIEKIDDASHHESEMFAITDVKQQLLKLGEE